MQASGSVLQPWRTTRPQAQQQALKNARYRSYAHRFEDSVRSEAIRDGTPSGFGSCRQTKRGRRGEGTKADRSDCTEKGDKEAAVAAALALASEPTIEKMVPINCNASEITMLERQDKLQSFTTREQEREFGISTKPPQSASSASASTAPQSPCASITPPVVDAALVARQGALKSGYLWKMGANVPRWKRRFFVLKPITMLFYYLSEHDTEPRGCIDLDLFDAVRKVREDRDGDTPHAAAAAAAASLRDASDRAGGGLGSNSTGDVVQHPTPEASGGWRSSSQRGRTGKDSSTTFELYHSGCPEGSGFMLEARGEEDWEEWVESIANGRHGKMRAEMDVMKGANKLLLDEINDLEHQVATFRGYADQRHVTVLALRDERQRNRETLAEIAALGSMASALSNFMSESAVGERQQQHDLRQQQPSGTAFGVSVGGEHGETDHRVWQRAPSELSHPSAPLSGTGDDDDGDDHGGGDDSDMSQQPPPLSEVATAPRDDDHHDLQRQMAEERAHFESVRTALAEARAELARRARALAHEEALRGEVERKLAQANGRAVAAEEQASSAEAAMSRATGRVSVLERNVEYLQTQQRALRAELRKARQKAQVLKKAVRDMWSRQHAPPSASASASASSIVPSSSSPLLSPLESLGPAHGPDSGSSHRHQQQRHQRQGIAGAGVSESRHRARTWASMGDLAKADVPSSCNARGGGEGASLSTVAAPPGEDGAERQSGRTRSHRGSLRSCVSRESMSAAPTSDSGDTDFADRTNSEASDVEDDDSRYPGHYSVHESRAGSITSQFREGVCRSIRKRAGPPQVPPLPPPRHGRTLVAVRHLLSVDDNPEATATRRQQQQQQHQQQSEVVSDGTNCVDGGVSGVVVAEGAGNGTGGGPSGVAGMFLGLRKGMADMASQEMGKKFGLWPGAAGMAMRNVNSMSSLTSGAINIGVKGGEHSRTSLGSPRSGATSAGVSLTDSPMRWDKSSSSSHGSTASTESAMTNTEGAAEVEAGDCGAAPAVAAARTRSDAATAMVGAGVVGAVSVAAADAMTRVSDARASVSAAAAASASAVVAAAATNGLPRVGSVTSRMPLIQLSDLELAEPCGRRIESGGGESVRTGPRSPPSSPMSSAVAPSVSPCNATTSKRRLSCRLPPRPDDEYELLFTSRVIGLQFKGLDDGTGVFVAGANGYVGPAPTTGVPGERLCPDVGDILESYNGIAARGKSAEVVASELGRCGRPLRLGFRSARAGFLSEEAEFEERENTGAGAVRRGAGAGAGAGNSTCREDVTFAGLSRPWAVSS